MNQDQQPRLWWKDNWPLLALVALAAVITIIAGLGYWLRWSWTGLVDIQDNPDTKLAWEWLQLLIIPVLLGLGAFWFNNQVRESEQELARRERDNDREIAADRAREDALQRYLDRMQELILDKGLRRSEEEEYKEISNVARARTLAVLRSLDGDRKGQLVRFLYESDLIGKIPWEKPEESQVIEAIIDLRDANLRDTNLGDVNLYGAYLYGANLSLANLSLANLSYANLAGADLSDACLRNAELSDANLEAADLREADLSGVFLIDAEGWTNERLAQAASLVGATLPDGRVIRDEEDWEEFKKRYRQ